MIRTGESTKPSVGGLARVTGAYQYVGDIQLVDALHVKLVTLPCAHARIGSVDTRSAEQVPGVQMVMTAAHLPQPVPRFGPQFRDRPVLAVDETKYHGEPVAAVAAELGGGRRRGCAPRPSRLPGAAARPQRGGGRGSRRPPGAGPRTPPRRPSRGEQRPQRTPLRLGGRRGSHQRPRCRGRLHVPDGDAFRHRAPRIHGRPRR